MVSGIVAAVQGSFVVDHAPALAHSSRNALTITIGHSVKVGALTKIIAIDEIDHAKCNLTAIVSVPGVIDKVSRGANQVDFHAGNVVKVLAVWLTPGHVKARVSKQLIQQ